mgnify:CR=1 FL=1|tara:strand:- start:376 stop:873 length:498 start_codon:yes stop_codon:yes gene_type:complete
MTVSHQILVDYFKNITIQLKTLNGFFRMDITEIKGAFRSTVEFPALVMESYEGNFDDSNLQTNVNDRTFAFTIYTKPKNGDYDDQNLQLDMAEAIGLKVIARMRYDAGQKDHFLYTRFKVNTVTYAKVGPIFNEQLYGYRFIGSIKGLETLVLNPSDWNDAPTLC